ncbi:MAG TPA: glycosyltransferase, partial [Sphingomicrobium sp.]
MITVDGVNPRDSASQRALSLFQCAITLLLGVVTIYAFALERENTGIVAIAAIQCAFLSSSIWRIATVLVSQKPNVSPPRLLRYPRYTVMAALHGEVEVVGQLIGRLSRIDYPRDRLEAFLLLEAHDLETIAAARAICRPGWMRIIVVPPGSPRTKPRALNHGLTLATGDLVTIYDAEDDPHPMQLREAAARFAADQTG